MKLRQRTLFERNGHVSVLFLCACLSLSVICLSALHSSLIKYFVYFASSVSLYALFLKNGFMAHTGKKNRVTLIHGSQECLQDRSCPVNYGHIRPNKISPFTV